MDNYTIEIRKGNNNHEQIVLHLVLEIFFKTSAGQLAISMPRYSDIANIHWHSTREEEGEKGEWQSVLGSCVWYKGERQVPSEGAFTV